MATKNRFCEVYGYFSNREFRLLSTPGEEIACVSGVLPFLDMNIDADVTWTPTKLRGKQFVILIAHSKKELERRVSGPVTVRASYAQGGVTIGQRLFEAGFIRDEAVFWTLAMCNPEFRYNGLPEYVAFDAEKATRFQY